MAPLGWVSIGFLFRPYLPEGQVNSYIAGLIILAAAPCTAVVFVWSHLNDLVTHVQIETPARSALP
jgi:ACR3 family arsenite transporter